MAYIYALVDPRTGNVHYVGKTNGPLAKRLSEHINCQTTRNGRAWVRELDGLGLRPQIVLLEEVDKSVLDWRENYWMAVMAYRGEYLFNWKTNEYVTAALHGDRWDHPDPLPSDFEKRATRARNPLGMGAG